MNIFQVTHLLSHWIFQIPCAKGGVVPILQMGETEVSKEGIGPILQAVKLKREFWAFLMFSAESWPPSPLWKVPAPSLLCKTQSHLHSFCGSQHVWRKNTVPSPPPINCVEVGNTLQRGSVTCRVTVLVSDLLF